MKLGRFKLQGSNFKFLVLLAFCTACTSHRRPDGNHSHSAERDSLGKVVEARGFTIREAGDLTLLTVFNPWQGAQDKVFRYALGSHDKPLSDSLAGYTPVRTPVRRVVCLSTTHVAMLSALGKEESIKAISGSAFVNDSSVRRAIARGDIIDVGYDSSLDFEAIIALKPDVIFAYGVGQEVLGSLSKLTSLGLTVVLNAEYLESSLLARAEWLKFMAAFYNDEARADSLFNGIKHDYDSLKHLAAGSETRPTVICGLPWSGSWYIPGGHSSIAAVIADAGGNYLWKDNPLRESFPVNIENIISKGATADFWINTGNARSLDEIRQVDERLALTRPWQSGQVFNNCARANANGGNDFFESGIVRPQLILRDLIKIFHPDLLPKTSFYFYMKLH